MLSGRKAIEKVAVKVVEDEDEEEPFAKDVVNG
jgi:hypothetical protein